MKLTPEQLTKLTAKVFRLVAQDSTDVDDYDKLNDQDKVFMKLLALEINEYFEGK